MESNLAVLHLALQLACYLGYPEALPVLYQATTAEEEPPETALQHTSKVSDYEALYFLQETLQAPAAASPQAALQITSGDAIRTQNPLGTQASHLSFKGWPATSEQAEEAASQIDPQTTCKVQEGRPAQDHDLNPRPVSRTCYPHRSPRPCHHRPSYWRPHSCYKKLTRPHSFLRV